MSPCEVTVSLDQESQLFVVTCRCKQAIGSIKEWTPGSLREILDGKHIGCRLSGLSRFDAERKQRDGHTLWVLRDPSEAVDTPSQ